MPVSFPLLLYADEKTERTKKQFPSECRSVFSSRLQNAPEQKKLSNFLQTRTAAAEPDGFPVFLFSYFPHSIQKPDRQFCPVRFLSTYVFQVNIHNILPFPGTTPQSYIVSSGTGIVSLGAGAAVTAGACVTAGAGGCVTAGAAVVYFVVLLL